MPIKIDVNVAGLARALADPIRSRMIELLGDEDLCGCHFVEELGISNSLVSHHLKVLREAGLVSTTRERYWTYYRLEAEGLRALADACAAVASKTESDDRPRRACC